MSEPTGARRYGTGGGDAYYDAVKYGGYQGTREQFGQDQAEFAENAAAVAEAKEIVEQDTQEVRDKLEQFDETTLPAAIQAVQNEGSTQVQSVRQQGQTSSDQVVAVGTAQKDAVANEGRARVQAVTDEGGTQVQRVQDAATGTIEAVTAEGNHQIDLIETEGTTQVQAVADKGTEQVRAVNTAGQTQVQNVQDAGQEVLNSIPADYTELTGDVDNLNIAVNVYETVLENKIYTFTGITFINKTLSDLNGQLSESDNPNRISTQNYLHVPVGCTFSIDIASGFLVNTICYYDENNAFISSGSTMPSNCRYVRFTGLKDVITNPISAREAQTAFVPKLTYVSETDELERVVSQNKTDIKDLALRATNIDHIETYENVLLTLSKWQSLSGQVIYTSSNSRVSTPSGTTFDCYHGDVIGLSGYTGVQFRVAYTIDNGTTWTFGNWQSADYVCQSDGEYIITIMNTTEVVQSDVWDLAHLFFVRHLFRNNVVIQQADLQNESSLMFVWASDTHHQIHNGSLYGTPLSLIREMSNMSCDINADFVTITGDIVNGYYQVSEQKDNLVDVVRTVKENAKIPAFLVAGNHDDNSWYASGDSPSTTSGFKGMEQILTNAQFTTYAMNNTIDSLHIDPKNPLGGYYYKDFKKSKTRVIVLNVIDIPYEMKSDGTGLIFYGQYTFGFQNKQLTWLAHDALKFDESGFGVIFLLHFDGNMSYTDYEVKNIAGLNEIVNAYRNNLAGTHVSQVPNFRGSVEYDFTSNPSNEVTAWFSGHCHADHEEIIDGVPHLTITNAFNADGGGYDLVTVDRGAKKIITKRYNVFALTAYDRDVSWT